MGAETFVIVNHSAARARAAWMEVRRALRGAGVGFDAHEAREFGDARRAAHEAVAAGYRTVAVVGGDGTLSEVVNGFFAREHEEERVGNENAADVALAILPAGTGNDFARSLEGRRASLSHWIARLVAHAQHESDATEGGTTRAVDVLRGRVAPLRGETRARRVVDEEGRESSFKDDARTFYCLNAVTLGVGAEVAARVAAQGRAVRRLSGEARFALAALPALARWRERRVRVIVDGVETREVRTNLVAVVNSRFAGGGMMFSPEARVDDGLLDVVTASRLSRAALAREMTRVHAGGHVRNPRVSIVRASRVLIEPVTEADALPVEADGDVRGVTPLELKVVPRALRVVI